MRYRACSASLARAVSPGPKVIGWEQDGLAATDTPQVWLTHAGCTAARARPALRCAHCGGGLGARNVGELRVSQREIERLPAKATPYRRSAPAGAAGAADGLATAAPLARCLAIFGDKWSIEIVVAAFMRIASFGAFQAHTGISTNILADRLARLVADGILRQSSAGEPGRTGRYALTERGLALYPVLLALQAWADDGLPDRLRSPLRLKHRPCGQGLRSALACAACDQALTRETALIHTASAAWRGSFRPTALPLSPTALSLAADRLAAQAAVKLP